MKKNNVYYTSKTESSVDPNMEDMPSNYNIQNGRFNIESWGLKGQNAILKGNFEII